MEEEISLERGLCFDGGVFDNRSQERAGLENMGKVTCVGAIVGELASSRPILPIPSVKTGPIYPHE